MFKGCSSLKELNVSHFNTENVKEMLCMFEGCSSLKELNLSNFNTKNAIKMSYMFEGCSSLEQLNISNSDFTNFSFNSVFCNCPDELKNKIKEQFGFKNEYAFEEKTENNEQKRHDDIEYLSDLSDYSDDIY